MEINQSIFREYDIRGIAGVKFDPKVMAEYEKWYGPFPGVTINLETTEAIGKAYGTIIKKQGGKKVLIGYEIRPFAEELKNALVKGVIQTGVSVVDAGQATTPFIYFLTAWQKFDGGINITGSHNVYFFNGFKMMKAGSIPIYGQELQELYQMVKTDAYDLAALPGSVEKLSNSYEVYKKYLLEHIKLARPLKIVIDCGNGTPGLFAKDLLESLGCEVLSGLYLEPNAYFPNHTPDPESPLNLKDLMVEVKRTRADLGVAFDADGDRAGFVDEKGEFVFADEVLLVFARDALARHPGKKILFDVKCSELFFEMIPQFGGAPLMHRTGHAPIKDTMNKDHNIILGGEVSGHTYFVENYFRIDDGFWAAAQLLRLLSEFNGPFSKMLSFIPKRVRTPEIKLPCEDSVKFAVVKKVVDVLAKRYQTINIDGVRVQFDQTSWGLVRASNTSPYLTIRVEAKTEARALEIKNILADVLDPIPEIQEKLNRAQVFSPTGKLGYL